MEFLLFILACIFIGTVAVVISPNTKKRVFNTNYEIDLRHDYYLIRDGVAIDTVEIGNLEEWIIMNNN